MNANDFSTDPLMCVNLQILRASHSVLKSYDDAYRPWGVKATQVPVLNYLHQVGAATTKDISAQTVTERSVLSRKLQIMQKNAWIETSYIQKTRENEYKLTSKGEDLVKLIKPIRQEVQNRLLSNMTEDEVNLLLNLVDKLQLASVQEKN